MKLDRKASFLVVVPPPVWALTFALLAWMLSSVLGLEPVVQNVLAGSLIFAGGFGLSAYGRMTFAAAKTEVMPASEKNSHLVTGGPFRFTRNPMYLGILIAAAGLSLVIGTSLAFAVPAAFFLLVNFVSIPYEEAKMERQFGESYRAYKGRVRRWI